MWPANGDDSDGFALVEALVSFVILSLVLGSAMLATSYGSRLHRRSMELVLVERLAENLIAEKFLKQPGLPAQESGVTTEGIRWRITRISVPAVGGANKGNFVHFTLTFSDTQGRQIDEFKSMYVEHLP